MESSVLSLTGLFLDNRNGTGTGQEAIRVPPSGDPVLEGFRDKESTFEV